MVESYVTSDTLAIVSLERSDKIYLEFRQFKPQVPLEYSEGDIAPSKPACFAGIFIDTEQARTLVETLSVLLEERDAASQK